MRRGDIVWVELVSALGAESQKRRPAVIVSNDGANQTAQRLGRGVVTVVPVTTKVRRVYPFQVLLPSERCELTHDSKAQAEQIRSVSVDRVGDVVGRVPADLLERLDQVIRLHLAL